MSFENDLKYEIDSFVKSKKLEMPKIYCIYYLFIFICASFMLTGSFLNSLVSNKLTSISLAFLSALITGFGMASSGLTIGHSLYHNSVFKSQAFKNLFGFIFSDCFAGASGFYWDQNHNKKHHKYPNLKVKEKNLDPDAVKTELLLKYSESKGGLSWARFGFILILAQFKYIFHRDFQNISRGEYNGCLHESITRKEVLIFIAGKIVFTSLNLILPIYSFGLILGTLAFVLAVSVNSLILHPAFLIAHTTSDVKFFEESDGPYKDVSFERLQIETAANFSMKSQIATLIFGGLNYQIEHHLFPGIHPHFYPRLSKIVRDVCIKHDVGYVNYEKYKDGVCAVRKFLNKF